MNRFSLIVTVALSFLSQPAAAVNLQATPANFVSVMYSAHGGDTVTVSGVFGRASLYDANYSSPVTVDATAATFTDTLAFGRVSNIAVIGGTYGSATGMTAWGRAVVVSSATNVSFTNPTVVGFYGGQGIMITDTTNATVTGATLSRLDAGIVFGNVVGGSITNNQSLGSTSDGIDVVNSSHIDVGFNRCVGSTPIINAHPDCVQLWSSPGYPRQDHIVIHDNYASGATQGFTEFASFGIGADYISMVNNRVDSLMSQAVACYSCANSIFTGNVITTMPNAPYEAHMSIIDGTNNIVSNNSIADYRDMPNAPSIYYDVTALRAGTVQTPTTYSGPNTVPEPAGWAMLVTGFGFVGCFQRRDRRVAA